VDYTEAPAAWR